MKERREVLQANHPYGDLKYENDVVSVAVAEKAMEQYADIKVKEAQRWIPVTERLPEIVQPVLATVKLLGGGTIPAVVCYTDGTNIEVSDDDGNELLLSEGWYEECEQQHGDYDVIYFKREVTHWMPLPNKPELT